MGSIRQVWSWTRVAMSVMPGRARRRARSLTPPERICRNAASSDPSRSMARQASSSTVTSKPCATASIADQETQKSVASPASQTRRTPRSRR